MRFHTLLISSLILALCAFHLGCENTPEEPNIHPDGADAGMTDVYSNAIHISELSSSGDDPIELFNWSFDSEVDISGWLLTDDLAKDAEASTYDAILDDSELVFAEGTVLGPRSYLVINKGEESNQHPFGLSGDGDTVTLMNPAGEIAYQVTYAAGDANISYCQLPESEWLTDPDPQSLSSACQN